MFLKNCIFLHLFFTFVSNFFIFSFKNVDFSLWICYNTVKMIEKRKSEFFQRRHGSLPQFSECLKRARPNFLERSCYTTR